MADGMQPSKLIRLNTKINSSSYPILIGKNIIKSLPKNERTKLLARFNLEISMSELARVREAVRKGKIWEYVERNLLNIQHLN